MSLQNFFSTSFVGSSLSENGSSEITITSDWWISLAAALPLTIVTLAIWRIYVQTKIDGHKPMWLASMGNYMPVLRRRRQSRREGLLPSERELHVL